MLKKIAITLVALVAAVLATLWAIAAPAPLSDATLQGLGEPDLENGERIFVAGGCGSCHGAVGEDGDVAEGPPVLAGGLAIESDFGTFHVPNISPSEAGIGDWTFEDFAAAMLNGVSPEGTHYYPAFPYGSFSLMDVQDVNDLWGYILTLPESDNRAPPHEIPFPFNINRAVGLWKYLYMPEGNRVAVGDDPVLQRGQYLVEAVGHCGECHTPRNALGGFEENRWLAGAENPDGEGQIPNITPGGSVGDWSEEDLVYYFETGFTPDYDVVGGSMVEVQEGLARLTGEDRAAIAAYLKAVPERE